MNKKLFFTVAILSLTFSSLLSAQAPERTKPATESAMVDQNKKTIFVSQSIIDQVNLELREERFPCTISRFEAYYKLGGSRMISIHGDTSVKCKDGKTLSVQSILTDGFRGPTRPEYDDMVVAGVDQAFRVATTASLKDQKLMIQFFLEGVLAVAQEKKSCHLIYTMWVKRDNERFWVTTSDPVSEEIFLKY